jgi:hypothetical protein
MRGLALSLVLVACGMDGATQPATIVPEPPPFARGGIMGVVDDGRSAKPLPNAIVILEGGTPSLRRETTTTSAGRFHLVDVPAGTYSLQVLYGESEVNRIVVHDGDTRMRADFTIDPRPTWNRSFPLERSLLDDDGETELLHRPRVIHPL